MTSFFRHRKTWLVLLLLGVLLPVVGTILFFGTPVINTVNFESIAIGVPLEYAIYGTAIGLPVVVFGSLFAMGLVKVIKNKEASFPRPRSRVWQVILLLWVVFFGFYAGYFLGNLPASIYKETYMVQMSDGVHLHTVLYRNSMQSARPVMFIRTCYGSILSEGGVDDWVERGFHVVVQDCRGCPPAVPGIMDGHFSEGDFYPFIDDFTDGNETINWIARQPWCNGKVLMSGASYLGWTQFAAAFHQPEALVAISPTIFGSTPYKAAYCNGMFQLTLAGVWLLAMEGCTLNMGVTANIPPPLSVYDDTLCAGGSPIFDDVLNHSTQDAFWDMDGTSHGIENIIVPMYHEIGYFDYFAWTGVQDFKQLGTRNDFAANHSVLVLAPHGHMPLPKALTDVEPAAKRNINSEIEQFIVNAASGTFPGRQVSAYIIGNNTWLNGTSWPLAGVTMETYYLREGGILSPNAPTTAEASSSYLYDPHHTLNYMNNPVKNITWGDYADHSVVTRQGDSLVYALPIPSGGPGMTLCGQAELHLNATTNCTDTDWVIEVLDHDPVANTSMFLCHGMLRAAFNGSNFVPVVPGAMKEYVFESWPIGAYFKPGHVLQLVVRSSKYPYYAKNSNNGNPNFDTTWVVANNTIHHSDVSSSCILLPVV